MYLRNASQYSASIGGLGQSVQFWGGGNVYVLGVSDSTTASPYSPAVAVFNNSTHALVCATSNNTCAGTPASWTSGAVSYPVGHSVQEQIFYNTGNGDLTFTVNDLTAGTTSGFTLNIGPGVSFKEVRIGSEFGDTPWSAPTFTPPASQLKVAAFSGGRLTNYKGTRYGFSGVLHHLAADHDRPRERDRGQRGGAELHRRRLQHLPGAVAGARAGTVLRRACGSGRGSRQPGSGRAGSGRVPGGPGPRPPALLPRSAAGRARAGG